MAHTSVAGSVRGVAPNITGPLVKMVKEVMGETVDPRKGHSPEEKQMVLSILQRDGQLSAAGGIRTRKWCYAPGPKPGASTNSATAAWSCQDLLVPRWLVIQPTTTAFLRSSQKK
jgi:hypothetical protein